MTGDADSRFDENRALLRVEIRGEIGPAGFLDVAGEIGDRQQLLRAIDAMLAAANRLWPKPPAPRRVVPMPGDREGA